MKKLKNPNGHGCVTKLSGNRRKKWYAKVTIGWDENGKAIIKILTDKDGNKYFKDRTIPDLILAQYNINKGNIVIQKEDLTFEQIYKEFVDANYPTKEEQEYEKEMHTRARGKLGISNMNACIAAYNASKKLYKSIYKSLRTSDFENVINSVEGKYSKIKNLKHLYCKLDDFALKRDYIIKGYAKHIKIDMQENITHRFPYTHLEIAKIWKLQGDLMADILLILFYSGLRIEELLSLKTENIDLENNYMVCGIKTKNSKNRIIPIHSKIKQIILRYYDKDKKYLITINNYKLSYNKYKYRFNKFMKELHMEHVTHEARHTFETELDRLKINRKIIDTLMGHKSNDIGNDVYNHKTLEELIEAIDQIEYNVNIKQTYKIVI